SAASPGGVGAIRTVSPRRPRGLRPRRQTKRSKVLYGTCTPRSPSNSCTRVNCKCSSCSHVVICSRYGSNRSACGDAHVRGALTTRPTWTNRTTCSSVGGGPLAATPSSSAAPKVLLYHLACHATAAGNGALRVAHLPTTNDFDDLHATQLPITHPAHLVVADMVMNQ